ncbi:MAG: SDR family oxidoreductase [Bacteroidetes bacterium]|nr:SDR family oxidoreductase [Bacteroidota bacterium]
MNRILVTGATGNLGASVVDFLLNKTNSTLISALVRDPQNAKALELKAKGVETRTGDYNDFTSLVNAFKGIDKLYFVSGSDIQNRYKQHENVVKAAKEAGVKQVVYTSFSRKNETETSPIAMVADSHIRTENLLKASGLNYTILKHGIYMDMLPLFLGDQVVKSGVAYFPAGDGKVSFTLRNDMAEAAAVILTTEGHANKIYDMTNTQTVSFSEIAAAISNASGTAVTYVSPAPEEYIQTLSSAGVPMEYVGMFAGFAEAFKQGEFDQVSDFMESLIGRKPTSVSQFLSQVYTRN